MSGGGFVESDWVGAVSLLFYRKNKNRGAAYENGCVSYNERRKKGNTAMAMLYVSVGGVCT